MQILEACVLIALFTFRQGMMLIDLASICNSLFGLVKLDNITVCFWLKPSLEKIYKEKNYFLFDFYPYTLTQFLNNEEELLTPFYLSNFMLGCGMNNRFCMSAVSEYYRDIEYIFQQTKFPSLIKVELVNSPNKYRNICYTIQINSREDQKDVQDAVTHHSVIESIRFEHLISTVHLNQNEIYNMLYNFLINDTAASIVNIRVYANINYSQINDYSRYFSYSGLSSHIGSVSILNILNNEKYLQYFCSDYSLLTSICVAESTSIKNKFIVDINQMSSFYFGLNTLDCMFRMNDEPNYSNCNRNQISKIFQQKSNLEVCINGSDKSEFKDMTVENCKMKDINEVDLLQLDNLFLPNIRNFNSMMIKEKSSPDPLFYYEIEGVYLQPQTSINFDFSIPFSDNGCFCYWTYFETLKGKNGISHVFSKSILSINFTENQTDFDMAFLNYQDNWIYTCFYLLKAIPTISISTLSLNRVEAISLKQMNIPSKFIKKGVVHELGYEPSTLKIEKLLLICKFRSDLAFAFTQLRLVQVQPSVIADLSYFMKIENPNKTSINEFTKELYYFTNSAFTTEFFYFGETNKFILSFKVLETFWYDWIKNGIKDLTFQISVVNGPRILFFKMIDLIQGSWAHSLLTTLNSDMTSLTLEVFRAESTQQIMKHNIYVSKYMIKGEMGRQFLYSMTRAQLFIQADENTNKIVLKIKAAIPDFAKCLFPIGTDFSGEQEISLVIEKKIRIEFPCCSGVSIFSYFKSMTVLEKIIILKDDFDAISQVQVGILLIFTKYNFKLASYGFYPRFLVKVDDLTLSECFQKTLSNCYSFYIKDKTSNYLFKMKLSLNINPENYQVSAAIIFDVDSYIVNIRFEKMRRHEKMLLNSKYPYTQTDDLVYFTFTNNVINITSITQIPVPTTENCEALENIFVYLKTDVNYEVGKISGVFSLFEKTLTWKFNDKCEGLITLDGAKPESVYDISFFLTDKIFKWGADPMKSIIFRLEKFEFSRSNFDLFNYSSYKSTIKPGCVYVPIDYSGSTLDTLEFFIKYEKSDFTMFSNQFNIGDICKYRINGRSGKDYSSNLISFSCFNSIFNVDYDMSQESELDVEFIVKMREGIEMKETLTIINSKNFDDFQINIHSSEFSLFFSVYWSPSSNDEDELARLYDCNVICSSSNQIYHLQHWKRDVLLRRFAENKFDLGINEKEVELSCTLTLNCFIEKYVINIVESKPFHISRVKSNREVEDFGMQEINQELERLENAITNNISLITYNLIFQKCLNTVSYLIDSVGNIDISILNGINVSIIYFI